MKMKKIFLCKKFAMNMINKAVHFMRVRVCGMTVSFNLLKREMLLHVHWKLLRILWFMIQSLESLGYDLKKMSTVSYDENLQDAKKLAELFYTIYSCEKPTICFAHGKAIGGGLGLLAASDIAIAAPDAGFCFSEVKIGLIPAVISPFVTQRIGYQAAKYEMMTAELFDAQKALKIGLIDKDDQDAMGLAEIMLANSQHAMQEIKAWLNKLKPITQEQVNQAAELLASIRAANR